MIFHHSKNSDMSFPFDLSKNTICQRIFHNDEFVDYIEGLLYTFKHF